VLALLQNAGVTNKDFVTLLGVGFFYRITMAFGVHLIVHARPIHCQYYVLQASNGAMLQAVALFGNR
jgi:hypothetical protein